MSSIVLVRTLGVFLLLGHAAPCLLAQAVNVDTEGLGVGGYDVVAYVTLDRALPGSPGITATHAGITYRFATAEHREAFLASPARYLPAFGGYCAFGVARGYKVKVDPEAFRIVDGILYLNYDKGVQRRWLADVNGYIAKANANWQRMEAAPRSD